MEEWDASKDLYEMLDVNEYLKESEMFKKYIPNYKINLIDAGNMEHLEHLQTDLQVVLGMIQFRGNTEKLKEYVAMHKEFFSSVDKDTYNAIVELLHSKSKLKKALKAIDTKNGKEQVNVCKAIDGIYEEGYNKAKEEMMELVQKAEAEKQKAEAKAAKRMMKAMNKETVAELLGLELEIVNQLNIEACN